MNTNPDEATLALWLDDELAGEDLAAVEAWALTQPEQLAAREEIRHWRVTMASALPATEEPPYPEFFNSRVLQAIRELAPAAAPSRRSFSWKSWLMPVAACAGMALTFWAGGDPRRAGCLHAGTRGGCRVVREQGGFGHGHCPQRRGGDPRCH